MPMHGVDEGHISGVPFTGPKPLTDCLSSWPRGHLQWPCPILLELIVLNAIAFLSRLPDLRMCFEFLTSARCPLQAHLHSKNGEPDAMLLTHPSIALGRNTREGFARRTVAKVTQPWVHQNRASPFASDSYRRRGYRRESRINFTRFHRRKNRGSLAILFAEEIAHLWASRSRRFFRER